MSTKKLPPEERIRARLRELAEQAGEARRELEDFIDDRRRLGETAHDRWRPAGGIAGSRRRTSAEAKVTEPTPSRAGPDRTPADVIERRGSAKKS
jgi:hypothetical protein